jgi:hypothetical protein
LRTPLEYNRSFVEQLTVGKINQLTHQTVTIDTVLRVAPGRPRSGEERIPRVMVGFGALPADYDRITDTARECGVPIAEFCRQAISHYLDYLESQ